MPPQHKVWQRTWLDMNPGWELKFWTSKPPMPLLGDLYDCTDIPAVKADLARLEIIYQFGGVWIDTDMECLKPVSELFAGCSCFGCIEYDPELYGLPGPSGVNNCMFGAEPGHRAIEALIRATDASESRLEPLGGPRVFRDVMHRRTDVRLFEQGIFMPFVPGQTGDIPETAYAIHHFEGSWRSQNNPAKLHDREP